MPFVLTGVDSQGVETASHNVANPSIGPSIGEMSVAMTNSLSASGSHMERAGLMRDESDRDSASNRALIGTSLSGSLSGSAVAGPSGFLNRYAQHSIDLNGKWNSQHFLTWIIHWYEWEVLKDVCSIAIMAGQTWLPPPLSAGPSSLACWRQRRDLRGDMSCYLRYPQNWCAATCWSRIPCYNTTTDPHNDWTVAHSQSSLLHHQIRDTACWPGSTN